MSGSGQGIITQLTKLPPATAESDAQVGLGIPSSSDLDKSFFQGEILVHNKIPVKFIRNLGELIS